MNSRIKRDEITFNRLETQWRCFESVHFDYWNTVKVRTKFIGPINIMQTTDFIRIPAFRPLTPKSWKKDIQIFPKMTKIDKTNPFFTILHHSNCHKKWQNILKIWNSTNASDHMRGPIHLNALYLHTHWIYRSFACAYVSSGACLPDICYPSGNTHARNCTIEIQY